jgi:ABC-type sulfate transport system permease component
VLFLTIPLIIAMIKAIDAELVEQLNQPTVVQAIKLSLVTTAINVLLMSVLGTPLAHWLARGHVPARPMIETVLDLPIMLASAGGAPWSSEIACAPVTFPALAPRLQYYPAFPVD